ncbi:MAG: hypothetical protein CM15mP21_3770 [Hyphomicrobiales bacterium]|nr:MAG: hypothetical protein CM15mP21_3770 [Hyphomicrobiales bacterium]
MPRTPVPENRHVKIIQLFRSQTRQMLAHHAVTEMATGSSISVVAVLEIHMLVTAARHQYSHKIRCLRANKAQEPEAARMCNPPLNGQRKHKAAKQQKVTGLIAARGLRHRHNVEARAAK